MFIIRRSKLHYTASGIITPIGAKMEFIKPPATVILTSFEELPHPCEAIIKFPMGNYLPFYPSVYFYARQRREKRNASS